MVTILRFLNPLVVGPAADRPGLAAGCGVSGRTRLARPGCAAGRAGRRAASETAKRRAASPEEDSRARQGEADAEAWPTGESLRFGRGLALALAASVVVWILVAFGLWYWLS
jgi:hypothetical protein